MYIASFTMGGVKKNETGICKVRGAINWGVGFEGVLEGLCKGLEGFRVVCKDLEGFVRCATP